MKTTKFILLVGAGLLISGGQVFADSTDSSNRPMLTQNQLTNNDPKNTSENVRDRNGKTVLPEDQANQKDLLERTASIRREITNSNNFSVSAKNIKIVTLEDGTVVLRGPVNSRSEKSQIESIARKESGKSEVKSYLEVAE